MNAIKNNRFTLIELLVVVAIIAVIASMLLPALASAREAAKRSACMNRLKNVNLGTMMYRDDYDQYFPLNELASGAQRNWHYLIKPYTPLREHTGSVVQLSARDNYLLCPSTNYSSIAVGDYSRSWAQAQRVWNSQAWVGGWEYYVGSYYTSVYYGQENLYDDGAWAWYRACKPKRRTHGGVSPDQRILVGEISNDNNGEVVSRYGYTNNPSLSTYPHQERTNILLLDGHVSTFNNLSNHMNKNVYFYTNEEVAND